MNKKLFIVILVAVLLLLIGAVIWILSGIGDDMPPSGKPDAPVQEVSITQDTQESSEQTESDETSQTTERQPTEESSSAAETAQEESTENQTDATTEQPESTTEPTQENLQQARIDELIEMVYALRDEYTARLYQIEQNAIAQYRALPEEEKTAERKQEIALAAVDEAYALEKECDARINEICLELGTLLIETGGDLTLLNQIRHVYASEKTAAKNELTERYAALLG